MAFRLSLQAKRRRGLRPGIPSFGWMMAKALSTTETLNLILRVAMEVGIVVALAYWGHQTGSGATAWLWAILAPLIGFGFWGLVDFHQLGRWSEPARLVQELVLTGVAALALIDAGQPALGVLLAAVSCIHHGLVYALGDRLIKQSPHAA